MFRKIHSNRNPDDTIWRSLMTEFAVYINKAKSNFKSLLIAYPKHAYAIMVLLLLGSMLLTLTIGKPAKPKSLPENSRSLTQPARDGLSRLITGAGQFSESIRLKEEISAILAKDSLNGADSVHLEKAIDRLHQLTIKTNSHEPH